MSIAARFNGTPMFFWRLCMAVETGDAPDYTEAGYELARETYDLVEWNDEEERRAKLLELREYVELGDTGQDLVLEWYEREFPRCVELIPAERREEFTAGVLEAWQQDEMEIV